MTRPRRGDLAKHWILDPETCFLNHGSFGATPVSVLEEQSRLRNLIESDPVRFFERGYIPLMKGAVGKLSEFINANRSRRSCICKEYDRRCKHSPKEPGFEAG